VKTRLCGRASKLYTIFNTPPPHGTGTLAKKEAIRYHFNTMATLVIKSFPEELHAKLKAMAAAHRRSVTQETIHLIETALTSEEETARVGEPSTSYWATRKLLPEYEALLKSGALTSETDSAIGLSEERDAR